MNTLFKSLFLLIFSLPAFAAQSPVQSSQGHFITLGTAGGPNAEVTRSQPANALVIGNDVYLVDAGDGAIGQSTKAGFRTERLKGLFISHLHFDHTGGVLALLGLRLQLNPQQALEIYGPPGTRDFIEGLVAGMAPAMEAAYGLPGQTWPVQHTITELTHGAEVQLAGATVRVAENTHYIIEGADESDLPDADGYVSLSYRFDLAERSIVYTGDTGPSKAVEELATGADILVSEMMDVPLVLEDIKRINPNMPPQLLAGVAAHLNPHHLTPQQVGELATAAGVKELVITHFVPSVTSPIDERKYRNMIREHFDGEIIFASDLDRF
jgi:ribonuclease BN (tRNA processing enzyme)